MIKILIGGFVIVSILSENTFSQTQLEKIVDISLSPVEAFGEFCTRCHGNEGSDFGKDFKNKNDAELEQIIEDMMFGPAFLNPDEIDLEAMVAFNKAIKENKPFAIVLNAKSFLTGKDKALKINFSSNTEIRINDHHEIKFIKGKDLWELIYNPEKIPKVEIIARKKGISSSFNFPEELWTR